MAIRGKAAGSAAGTEETETETVNDFELTFVDELPPPVRGSSAGRSMSAETVKLIEALKANPDKYAHVDVRKTGQPSRTLRSHGVLETFRKREDGMYDRYAAYVGEENIPETVPRGPRKPKDDDAE